MQMRRLADHDDPHLQGREAAALSAEEKAIREAEEDGLLVAQGKTNERIRARQQAAWDDPDNEIWWS
jgi:hypothetical protein